MVHCCVRLVISSLLGQCGVGVFVTSLWWPSNHVSDSNVCVECGKYSVFHRRKADVMK